MRLTLIPMLAGITVLTLAGCASQSKPPPAGAKTCPTPRAKMCTREYRPVIGFNADGQRLGSYGNHCSACGDEKVMYTLPQSRN